MLPFFGKCHIAYIPEGNKIVGISKLAEVIGIMSRKLQIQERLTTEIANNVMSHLKPKGVAVVIEARHLCMMMRGVEKQNSTMTTSCMLGSFRKNSSTRSEFLSLLQNKSE
jgi:GTP cyclohydrolase I